jgi:hypothetical protein
MGDKTEILVARGRRVVPHARHAADRAAAARALLPDRVMATRSPTSTGRSDAVTALSLRCLVTRHFLRCRS